MLLATLWWQLPAQSAVEVWIAAIQKTDNSAEVHAHLRQIWEADSNQVFRVSEEAMAAMEGRTGKMSRAQADTLLRIIRIGREKDPGGQEPWIIAQALLGMRQEQHFGPLSVDWAMEAMRASPAKVPLALVRETAARLAAQASASWVNAANNWSVVEQVMQRRALASGDDGAFWVREQARLTLRMRAALPDCGQLLTRYADSIARGALGAGECRAFLVMYALQGCDQAGLWEAAWSKVSDSEDTAWLHRMGGAEAMSREDWEAAKGHWMAAAAGERDVALKAADLLQVAATWREQGRWREARTALQEAMKHRPDWGEPYLQLMDLYIEGSDHCTWPDFEGRAMYWLLMELCGKLKAIDPEMEAEANARHEKYARRAPSLKEAAYLGWQPGDTYPLKCWMNTATVVPKD